MVMVIVGCREMASAELQTNIAASDTFTLPSGQEIKKENILDLGSTNPTDFETDLFLYSM